MQARIPSSPSPLGVNVDVGEMSFNYLWGDLTTFATGNNCEEEGQNQISHTVFMYKRAETNLLANKAFVGLGSCVNVQTETSIFKYANWPRLQV